MSFSFGSHLPPSPSTPWQPLYVMQHYGIPTRLLDWTEARHRTLVCPERAVA
ncbi:MAG: FRG domain-containing protein [Gemmatimonadetes bacterium]|nr:FRG domain-containing protein [Gemmatimonadota bacterium]